MNEKSNLNLNLNRAFDYATDKKGNVIFQNNMPVYALSGAGL